MSSRKTIEEWEAEGVELRPIPDVVGYAAGSDGHVYSFLRPASRVNHKPKYQTKAVRLRGSLTRGNGRPYVNLWWRGSRKIYVHRAVAEAFHGPCPEGMECSHLNGDKTDNRSSNLAWETHPDNAKRGRKHGSYATGERHGSAKLSEEDVRKLRGCVRRGMSRRRTAKLFGVSPATVYDIMTGKTWSHVADQESAALREREGGGE